MSDQSSDSKSKKEKDEELCETLREAHDLGSRLASKGRELTAAGQYIVDWVDITKESMSLIDTIQGLIFLNNSWKNTNNCVGWTVNHLDQIDLYALSSASAGSALSSVLIVPIDIGSTSMSSADSESVERIAMRIEEQTTKSHDKDSVLSLMGLLHIDSRQGGKRSAPEQLETAYNAFELTVDTSTPALTSLIPMRECMLQTIDVLLKKRNRQERTTGTAGKVKSVLEQLKRASVSEERIETLARQCKEILDKRLSPSKDAVVTRSEWLHSLAASILWLKTFLAAIDPGKMKQTTT